MFDPSGIYFIARCTMDQASLVDHSKESTCNTGTTEDWGSIPGLGRSPGEGRWQPIPVFLPE